MIRYVPPFILQKYADQEFEGQLNAYVVIFDIVDFTNSCSALFEQGAAGVDLLSRYLDKMFTSPIEIAERYGGFISSFAGDACTIVFPRCDAAEVWTAVCLIHNYFEHRPMIEGIKAKVRLVVSHGELQWRIYKNEFQNEYVFFGPAVDDAVYSLKTKREYAVSSAAAKLLGVENFIQEDKVFIPREDSFILRSTPNDCYLTYDSDPEFQKVFCHHRLRNKNVVASHRSAGFCFIRLESPLDPNVQDSISIIHKLADAYHGMVNKLEYSDKGFLLIVIFGIPVKTGRTAYDMCNFALDVRFKVSHISIGISTGFVLACYTGGGYAKEYTAYGHHMNLAARLMVRADKGEILTDETVYNCVSTFFFFQNPSYMKCKGFKDPIRINLLVRKLSFREFFKNRQFYGRDTEISSIIDGISKNLSSEEPVNQVLYVSGDPGVGKSQLIKEVYNSLEAREVNCLQLSVSCEEKNNRALSAIKQILGLIFHVKIWDEPDVRLSQFQGIWQNLGYDDFEMQRIESFIASILNISWADSEWSRTPQSQKESLRKDAFVTLCKRMIQTHHAIVLFIDDGQWLDEESLDYLRELSTAGAAPFIIVTACRYKEGMRVDFKLSNHKAEYLDLIALEPAAVKQMIQNLLRPENELPNETVAFINSYAQGVPLFIEQLTMAMVQTGKVDENGMIRDARGYPPTLVIDDVIGMRIDCLSTELQQCLYQASVLGKKFPVKVLYHMFRTDVSKELKAGETNRIWQRFNQNLAIEIPHDVAPLEYVFTHVLIQSGAYKRVLEVDKRNYHYQAAVAMEDVFDHKESHAQEIAHHYELAQVKHKAGDYYLIAGRYYRDQYNFPRATDCFQKALQLREELNQFQDMVDVLNAWAELLILQGERAHMDKAMELLNRSTEICSLLERTPHQLTANTLHVKANLLIELSRYDEANVLLQDTLDIYQTCMPGDLAIIAEVTHDLANLYEENVNKEEAIKLYKKAISLWEECEQCEGPQIADSMNDLARVLADLDMREEAEEYFIKAMKIREKTLGAKHVELTETLNDYANFLIDYAKYDDAEPLLVRALDIRRNTLGDKHLLVADTLHSLGVLYQKMNDDQAAIEHLNQALQIRQASLKENHPDLAESYHYIGIYYSDKTQYKDAREWLQKALSIREEKYHPNHPDIAETLTQLGSVLNELGDNQASKVCFERARRIQEQSLPTKHSDYAETLNDQANLDQEIGDFVEAESKYRSALQIRKDSCGEDSDEVAETLNELAMLYIAKRAKLEEAESMLLTALAIRKDLNGNLHRDTAQTMNDLGVLYLIIEDFDQSRHYLVRALAVRRKLDDQSLDYLESLEELANFFKESADYSRAIELLEHVLAKREVIQGKEHTDYAETLNELGTLYNEKNDWTNAVTCLSEALAIRTNKLKDSHPDLAESMNDLAESKRKQGCFKEASQLLEKAIKIRKSQLGNNNTELAESYHEMAKVLRDQGEYTEAEHIMLQAKSIREAIFDEDHSEVAESYHDLAGIYHKLNKYPEALHNYQHALKIRKEALPDDHNDISDTLHSLGELYLDMAQTDLAREHFEHALKIRRSTLGDSNPDTLKTQECLAKLENQVVPD